VKRTRVSIVIPTYNEKGNIIKLIHTIYKVIKEHQKWIVEIMVIDDDSPDGTGLVVRKEFKNNANVKVIIRKNERGLGTAIKLGVTKASGEIIVGMDADFNHSPTVIPDLLNSLEKADLVIASRFTKGGGMDNKFRYWATYLFNFFLKRMLGFTSTDNMSGFYAIRRKTLENLGIDGIYYGYGDYHLRLIHLANKYFPRSFSYTQFNGRS